MTPQATSKWFAFFLSASILALVILLAGCFGTFGLVVWRTSPVNGGNAVKAADIALDGGRFRVFTETGRNFGTPDPTASTSIRWQGWHLRMPDVKRAVIGFDAHALPLPSSTQTYLLAFPIWLIAVPFLIAPTIYLRRRLKKQLKPEGFTVIEIAGTNPTS